MSIYDNCSTEYSGTGFLPGDIFKEYTYKGGHIGELDPDANCLPGTDEIRRGRSPGTPEQLVIDDLEGAVRAEMVVEYWGGHIGTTGQAFKINNSEFIPIPQPFGTLTEPEAYYRTILGPAVPIPLDCLKEGPNVVTFRAGHQLSRYNFNWGFYWIYSFTIRIYYDSNKPHPTGIVKRPVSGTVGDLQEFEALISESPVPIKQVDFIGLYEDFSWNGTGKFTDWHYQYRYGEIFNHIGSATRAPYKVKWNNYWVPDQSCPIKIAARITDANGMSYVTPAIELTLQRTGRSVKMYKPSDVPENFGSRVGNRKTCSIIIDDNLEKARTARLVFSSWSAAHAEQIGLNDTVITELIGVVHDYSYDTVPISKAVLKQGKNVFFIYSSTEHHAAEINWPGPVILVEFIV